MVVILAVTVPPSAIKSKPALCVRLLLPVITSELPLPILIVPELARVPMVVKLRPSVMSKQPWLLASVFMLLKVDPEPSSVTAPLFVVICRHSGY